MGNTEGEAKPSEEMHRRDFSMHLAFGAMACGLAASYGTFGWFAGRFLYPSQSVSKRWMFVAELARMKPGESMAFKGPGGERINIARQGTAGSVEDFIALSGTCPHLGCQVHWEALNKRFFCPCHNGIFDPLGKGIGGPPGDAKQNLPRYPLKAENGLLYIEVPTGSFAGLGEGPAREGTVVVPGQAGSVLGRG